MTLIVGFKNKKIALIGADTQISSYNGAQEIIDRALIHKIDLVSQNLMFSYLGKWDDLKKDTLSEFQEKLVYYKNKVHFAFRFIKRINNDAIIIGFWNLGLIWPLIIKARKESKIEKLNVEKGTFYFNDPNSNLPNYIPIENRIKSFLNDSSSLENYLFTINNTILSEIVQGKDLTIPGLALNNNRNTVGGYVTIGIIVKQRKFALRIFNKTRSHNLFKYYQNGTLLNNITMPFDFGLNHSRIIYLDNLAMILKSVLDNENESIKSNLFILMQNQIDYILDNDLLECYLVNQIVNYIRNKYELNLNDVECCDDFIIADDNDLSFEFCRTFFD